MIYNSAREWRESPAKRVLLFGMSGLGKTYLSNALRGSGNWFHYSVDYRIGTRYMGEHIADNFKREAMKVPLLRELLKSDSVYISSNITFNNLAPLSTYLGKPGNADLRGLPFDEYMRRQDQHRVSEIAALNDTPHFIDRAKTLYGYDNFVCDSGGSICEVVDPDDPNDPVLKTLADSVLMVWIKGSDNHTEELIRRFTVAPKPMYYAPDQMRGYWQAYLAEKGVAEGDVDPEDPNDPVLKTLADAVLMVWIKGSDDHTEELIRRFTAAPKPMYYAPDQMRGYWQDYLAEKDLAESDVDPDDFMRWSYAKALSHRQPRYAAMAENWGVTICAEDVAKVKTAEDFETLIEQALENKAA